MRTIPHRAHTPVPSILATSIGLVSRDDTGAREFAPGRGFEAAHMRATPAVLVPVFGLIPDEAAGLFRLLSRAQSMTMGFRPIVLTDSVLFNEIRPYGWLVEHVMSEYDHVRLACAESWVNSVIRRAQQIADFFKVVSVAVPDPADGYAAFLRQLRDLVGSEVGGPLKGDRPEIAEVAGWRSWRNDGKVASQSFNVRTASNETVRVEIHPGRADNSVLIEGQYDSRVVEAFVEEADERGWPVVYTDGLDALDDVELKLAVMSLASFGEPEGTCAIFCSRAFAERMDQTLPRMQVQTWTYEELFEQTNRPSFADIELATTIRRASSALARGV